MLTSADAAAIVFTTLLVSVVLVKLTGFVLWGVGTLTVLLAFDLISAVYAMRITDTKEFRFQAKYCTAADDLADARIALMCMDSEETTNTPYVGRMQLRYAAGLRDLGNHLFRSWATDTYLQFIIPLLAAFALFLLYRYVTDRDSRQTDDAHRMREWERQAEERQLQERMQQQQLEYHRDMASRNEASISRFANMIAKVKIKGNITSTEAPFNEDDTFEEVED